MSAAPDRPDTATEVDAVVARPVDSALVCPLCGDRRTSKLDLGIHVADDHEPLAARRPATETEQAVERCLRDLVEAVGRGDGHGLPEAYRAARAALGGAARDGDGR